MDIYVVRRGSVIVGISARLQGAELIRADCVRVNGDVTPTVIENHELRDMED